VPCVPLSALVVTAGPADPETFLEEALQSLLAEAALGAAGALILRRRDPQVP
jgi:hypothetical protein